MPEKWTGNLIGQMHCNNVTLEDLANEMGCTKAYISMILNCRRKPPKARERLEEAFKSVLKKKKQ